MRPETLRHLPANLIDSLARPVHLGGHVPREFAARALACIGEGGLDPLGGFLGGPLFEAGYDIYVDRNVSALLSGPAHVGEHVVFNALAELGQFGGLPVLLFPQ